MKRVAIFLALAMLAQPAWAMSTESLIGLCTKWKDVGYDDTLSFDTDGVSAVECAAYMNAMSTVGAQNCVFSEQSASNYQWDASSKQLAQFLLNNAHQYPEKWKYAGYSFFLSHGVHEAFPCEE
tara:strand:+ start:565 stop:936 length:372 start_codon:yes stop_codon:yes gene_type:complete